MDTHSECGSRYREKLLVFFLSAIQPASKNGDENEMLDFKIPNSNSRYSSGYVDSFGFFSNCLDS